jgi:D-glycero-alpha-D-manno-heptose-7-phosphate kinase
MIIVKTPLRISFVGGGSDMRDFYNRTDGKVVSTAIDKFVYAIVKERFDDLIYINYSRKECVESTDQIQHDLVREAMAITGVKNGVEITTLADIPSSGSGLGSSSSITVALLHAFYAYQHQLVSAEQLAQDACRIEIDILGKPIGRQDQYAAAFGGTNRFVFKNGDLTERTPIVVTRAAKRRFAASLLLYYTGIARSAEDILSRQVSNLNEPEKFQTMSRMVDLADPFMAALEKGDINRCGQLLSENWRLKQTMAKGISNAHIDKMYGTALNAGALAGKVLGAGGGGFLMLIVPRENQNRVFEAMRTYRELPFMLEEGGSKVIFDDRSYASK